MRRVDSNEENRLLNLVTIEIFFFQYAKCKIMKYKLH